MQLESFISFIRQANTYGESENWALCCSCIVLCWEVLYEAGADIGPVIKELQSNRKKSTSQHKEEGAHFSWRGTFKTRKKQTREMLSGRWEIGQVSLWKQHLPGKGIALNPWR